MSKRFVLFLAALMIFFSVGFVLAGKEKAQFPAGSDARAEDPPVFSPEVEPATDEFNISGQWNSNIGEVYEIQQKGNQFTWTAPGFNQSGTGTISGTTITLNGPGWTVKGTIAEADQSGNATRIEGENGVILFRSAGGLPPSAPTEPSTPSQPAAPSGAVISVSGQWNSNIGVVYEIQQNESQFTWSVTSLNQSGTGTVSGSALTMIGPGWTVKGTITEADQSGNATKIEGENGVILFRTSVTPGAQPAQAPPAVPESVPQQSAIPDISGKWKSNLGVVYKIQQNGDQFVWKVLLGLQTGAGKITGTAVTATWTGALGSGTGKGQLLLDGSTGKVAAIKWDNGVTFNRQ